MIPLNLRWRTGAGSPLKPSWLAEMYKLAATRFTGRSVLVVEQERCTADLLTRAVVEDGGIVVGEAADVFCAMAFFGTPTRVDCVVIDVALAVVFPTPIVPSLSAMGIEVVFVATGDDLFGEED